MKKLFKNKWITLFFLLITLSSFNIKNNDIETKIRIFENGFKNKDIDMVMSVFDKNALWEKTPTYDLFKADLLKLFGYYQEIDLHRINLKITKDNGYIISKADYIFDTKVKNNGDFFKQNVTFILLWENKNNDWKIISTNLPTFKKSASDLKNFDFSSEIKNISGTNIGENNKVISHSAFQNTLGKPCGTDKEFVRSLYQSVLERDLKVSMNVGYGKAHLIDLQNGGHRWRTIWNFFNSPEYKNKHKSHLAFIRDAYQSILGREPSNLELNDWPQIDRNDILRKFFNSDEYIKLMNNCTNTAQKINSSPIAGTWKLNQDNGYTGSMTIQQGSNNHFTGNVIWNGSLRGTIDGNVLGHNVNITIDYHNGDIGYYNGTLTADGNKIINGTVKGNNGVSANWTASKVGMQSIIGKWKWFNGVIVTIDQYGNVTGSNGGKGTLIVNNNVNYIIKWTNGYTDNLRLNGNTLNGKNQNGTNVWGERIIHGNNTRTNENVWALNASKNIFKWNGRNWDNYFGNAQDIGVGANGSVWITGTENHTYGGDIYRLEGSKFIKTSGQGVRIDVDPYGNPWAINNLGDIYKWQNNTWHRMPGSANDIGIGANGDVCIIGTDAINSNFGIYKWSGTQWIKFPGAAVRIDVGPTGVPWVVNSAGDIYKFTNNSWHHLPGKATDISTGADGTPWVIGTDSALGGHGIYKWNGFKWIKIPGGATIISAGGN